MTTTNDATTTNDDDATTTTTTTTANRFGWTPETVACERASRLGETASRGHRFGWTPEAIRDKTNELLEETRPVLTEETIEAIEREVDGDGSTQNAAKAVKS
jgi:hypothetical protein